MARVQGELREAAEVAVKVLLLDGRCVKRNAVVGEGAQEPAERVAVGGDRLDGLPLDLAPQQVEVHELGKGRNAGRGFSI
jgi:hypothetical protein